MNLNLFVPSGGLMEKVHWPWSSPVRMWRVWSEHCFRTRREGLSLWPKSNRFFDQTEHIKALFFLPLWKVWFMPSLISFYIIFLKHLRVCRMKGLSQRLGWWRWCHQMKAGCIHLCSDCSESCRDERHTFMNISPFSHSCGGLHLKSQLRLHNQLLAIWLNIQG